ncbi:MAG: hypothetical protein GY851_34180 [bacterium]|nr:hypothetical protein [bacterium]
MQTDPHKCAFGQWRYGQGRQHAEELLPQPHEVLAHAVSATDRALPEPRARSHTRPAAHKVDPEQMIPLEKEDLKDF